MFFKSICYHMLWGFCLFVCLKKVLSLPFSSKVTAASLDQDKFTQFISRRLTFLKHYSVYPKTCTGYICILL